MSPRCEAMKKRRPTKQTSKKTTTKNKTEKKPIAKKTSTKKATTKRVNTEKNDETDVPLFFSADADEGVDTNCDSDSNDGIVKEGGFYLSKCDDGWSLDSPVRDHPKPKGIFAIPSELGGRRIVQIGNMAFRDAVELTSIEIPDTIMRINGQAFYGAFSGCTSLKVVRISKNLVILGSGTFGDCMALEEIEIPDSVKEIGAYVFAGCKNLKKVKLPRFFKEADASLFEGCESLEYMEFPERFEKMGQDVFKGCISLKKVMFPSSFSPEEIYSSVFRGCDALETIVFQSAKPDDFDEKDFVEFAFADSPNVKIEFAGSTSM